MKRRIIRLTPPQITPEHIKEKIVCIRAHRERMFRVCPEFHDNKMIFHNYGQGGAGWTFLFGCVNESLRQFGQALIHNAALKTQPIAVVGAGCYGLLTAIYLAKKGHNVTIIAKDTQDIASYKAAGFFFPRPRKSSTVEEIACFQARGIESYGTYLQIIRGTHGFIKNGARLIPAYYGPDIDPGFNHYIQEGLIQAPERVMIDFGAGKVYDANEYSTVFIDAVEMMNQLNVARILLGIPVILREIHDFKELNENIIFNCTGLGAKKLTLDPRLIPVQGHLITLQNQNFQDTMRYMLNVKVTMRTSRGTVRDELIYYAPKDSGILGITFMRGQDSVETNHNEFDRLLERCSDFFGTTPQ